MLFPTVDFAIFFALVFLGHWLLNPKPLLWKLFMIGASYVFYAWWDIHFIWLLAAISTLSQLGAVAVARQQEERAKRWTMAVAVALTLLPLAYFKYYGFFSLNLTEAANSLGLSAELPLIQVILPVGVSFFSFMAVSYIVDVFRGHTTVASWIDVFLYLSFFPHLVAGPIVRPDELIPQLDVRRDPRHVDVVGASWLIFGGLFKKVVISSYLASTMVDPVFGSPKSYGAIDVLVAIVSYAIVIYADFSGYTDIAIGIAKLLGFQFPQNFDRPYSARSLQDFWRRWHITLSRWLRDYLYIPLGGSKKGEMRTYVNIIVTMVLGGLWHGAAWTFVFWGLYHGVGQAIGAWKRTHLPERTETPMLLLGQRVGTFALVCVGWVFFRSDSMATAFTMLGRLITGWGIAPALVNTLVLGSIVLMLALQYAPHRPAL
ncbi:MAG TPA: MBOAT family O-acyltransferase, partial [Actinomycetota bacterium]|nr:MBOAT family O-acyltransferase [Actinomycetota bacterium]